MCSGLALTHFAPTEQLATLSKRKDDEIHSLRVQLTETHAALATAIAQRDRAARYAEQAGFDIGMWMVVHIFDRPLLVV